MKTTSEIMWRMSPTPIAQGKPPARGPHEHPQSQDRHHGKLDPGHAGNAGENGDEGKDRHRIGESEDKGLGKIGEQGLRHLLVIAGQDRPLHAQMDAEGDKEQAAAQFEPGSIGLDRSAAGRQAKGADNGKRADRGENRIGDRSTQPATKARQHGLFPASGEYKACRWDQPAPRRQSR